MRTATDKTLDLLRAFESRNVTFMEPDGSWPIVWESARGVYVRDAEGKRYLDLTAAFGVAAAGHANPRVVRAGQRQMARLLHAMGDVHPHPLKAKLAERLSKITFERWSGPKVRSPKSDPGYAKGFAAARVRNGTAQRATGNRGKTIFCNSGFEAVEAALKTALLATGKAGVIAFEGAYHGLGYGALNATHRAYFRAPFRSQLKAFGRFVPFPMAAEEDADERALRQTEKQLRGLLRRGKIGAILVEPIQARGGIRVPPPGFLPLLRRLCDEHKVLLILDEIYTGFGRTGAWFACEQSATVPDLVCLGKALTGGFPLSACVGRADLMDAAWPAANGEAIHTSTFLGHPVGCAMALAEIQEIEQRGLVRHSAELGRFLISGLQALTPPSASLRYSVRGQGLLVGLELRRTAGAPATDIALRVMKDLLRRGFILLPEGEFGNIISFTPPLTISRNQLRAVITALNESLCRLTSL